ncbi:MAG: ATP-binding protein [Fibrobacteraceae bacterium]
MIKRILADVLKNAAGQKKIVALIGARQVGKTTLLTEFLKEGRNALSLNCDDFDDRFALEDKSTTELRNLLNGHDIVFIDEAQRVKNIGLTLKKIADLKLGAKIFVTGSSSLELANTINEPATGRILEYSLFPFSLAEVASATSFREEKRLLENRMIFGLYPDVVNAPSFARQTLMNLTNNYLYKDILNFGGVKKPDMLYKLVRALAFQVGSEVNYNELGGLLGLDKETVENYIGLLEKCCIVIRLNSFSRNMRNEIRKGKKIYFYDNGIRNAVINNFSPLEARNDVGALWENLMVVERLKWSAYSESFASFYFWRTQSQQEIDLIEEKDGRLSAFEFKYNANKKAALPESFKRHYADVPFTLVNKDNFQNFVGLAT